jgi:hypothetical protein
VIVRPVLLCLAVALAGTTGCTASTDPGATSTPAPAPATAAAPPRTDIENALECYLVDAPSSSEHSGSTALEAVDGLTSYYPPIRSTEPWSRTSPADDAPATWLLRASDGRGYGTAAVLQPDPGAAEFVATVDALCVVALTPAPADFSYPIGATGSIADALGDPENAGFVGAMNAAIGGLSDDDAADALRAAGWRVRVGERDGVVQRNVGSAPTWINLVITDGLVTGFTIG